MESVLLGLAVLACPVGMGVMMWVMGRGMRKNSGKADTTAAPSVETLREEHRHLGEQIDRLESDESEPLSSARA